MLRPQFKSWTVNHLDQPDSISGRVGHADTARLCAQNVAEPRQTLEC